MTAPQLRSSALNLRTRAQSQANKDRAAAWLKEADELEARAAELEKASPPPAAKK